MSRAATYRVRAAQLPIAARPGAHTTPSMKDKGIPPLVRVVGSPVKAQGACHTIIAPVGLSPSHPHTEQYHVFHTGSGPETRRGSGEALRSAQQCCPSRRE